MQTNIYQMYEKKVQEPLEKERTKTARQKYMKDCPSYEGYRQIVWVSLSEQDLHTSALGNVCPDLLPTRTGKLDEQPSRAEHQALPAAP